MFWFRFLPGNNLFRIGPDSGSSSNWIFFFLNFFNKICFNAESFESLTKQCKLSTCAHYSTNNYCYLLNLSLSFSTFIKHFYHKLIDKPLFSHKMSWGQLLEPRKLTKVGSMRRLVKEGRTNWWRYGKAKEKIAFEEMKRGLFLRSQPLIESNASIEKKVGFWTIYWTGFACFFFYTVKCFYWSFYVLLSVEHFWEKVKIGHLSCYKKIFWSVNCLCRS